MKKIILYYRIRNDFYNRLDDQQANLVNVGKYWWEIFTPYTLTETKESIDDLIILVNTFKVGDYTSDGQVFPGGDQFLNWAKENDIENFEIVSKQINKINYEGETTTVVSIECFITFENPDHALLFKLRWMG